MYEVWVDGQRADIKPDEVIALTFQVNDIAELRNRQASFSSSIQLPYTNTNNSIFENARLLQSDTSKPYRRLDVRLLHNGRDLIKGGVGILSQSSSNYSLRVFSGTFDFFDLLGDSKITDLAGLNRYSHIKDLLFIQSTYTNTEGIIYALIDYGQHVDQGDFFIFRYQNHSVFFKTIIDEIISNQGFTKEGSIFDDDLYNKILIPISEEGVTNKKFAEAFSYVAEVEADQNVPAMTTELETEFELQEGDLLDRYNLPAFVGYTFRYEGEPRFGNFRLRMQVQLGVIAGGETVSIFDGFESQVYDSSNSGDLITIDRKTRIDLQGFTTNYDQISITNDSNDTVTLLRGSRKEFIQDEVFKFDTPEKILIIDSFPVAPADNLPDVSQKDFMKLFAQIFGITFDFDGKKLIAKTFDEIFEDKAGADDWSDKIDLSRDPVLGYKYGNYTQKNFFSYDNDEEIDEDFARGVIEVDDTSLDEESDQIDFPVSASEDDIFRFTGVSGLLEFKGVKIPRYSNDSGANDYDDTVTYDTFDIVKHIGFEWFWTGVAPTTGIAPPAIGWVKYIFEDESASPRLAILDQYNEFPIAYFKSGNKKLSLDGQDIVDSRYSGLKSILNKAKPLTAYFLLTEDDIENLNFFKPKYIAFFNAYFYLNRVDKYIPGKLTKCKLIRI